MKHGKRPTLVQKELMTYYHLDPKDWLVVKTMNDGILINYRYESKNKVRWLPCCKRAMSRAGTASG